MTVNYEGQRFANNSPYEAINPTLYSNFQLILTQQLLAGFGISTNERYMHIAKKNLQITDLAFRAQVIATITQVENIYWDLVNAYQDEQVKERSLAFAQRTLQDDQKQLELKAIPAMQVDKDESDVATSEGDLTVSRATLRLNELLIKNALTKTDDAAIDEMPVIPLDRTGPPDPNASKSIDDLIADSRKEPSRRYRGRARNAGGGDESQIDPERAVAHVECLWLLRRRRALRDRKIPTLRSGRCPSARPISPRGSAACSRTPSITLRRNISSE